MSIIKAISLVFGIPSLYLLLTCWGTSFAGAGEGTAYFGGAMIAPFSAISDAAWTLIPGILFWVIVAVLLTFRAFIMCRIAAAIFLIAHYFGIAAVSFQILPDEWQHVVIVWDVSRWLLIPFLFVYFASQIFMWILVVRGDRRPNRVLDLKFSSRRSCGPPAQ